LEIYSNVFADNKTIILDVDRYTHPAWVKTEKGGYKGQEIRQFQNKFEGLDL
jgi:ribosomal protein L31